MILRGMKSFLALIAIGSTVQAADPAVGGKGAPVSHGSRNPAAERLDAILRRAVDGNQIFGATFAISTGDGTRNWVAAAGAMNVQSRFQIASITKMFTGAVVLKLREQGKLDLDDQVSKYLPDSLLRGIHVLEGTDRSKSITIRHLLTHTSGLPDYFTEPCGSEPSMQEIRKVRDMHYTLVDIIGRTRKMTPHFKPGEPGRAYYSDLNYQLLGAIIEKVAGKPLGQVYREQIVVPLGLENTYLQEKDGKAEFAPFYHQNQPLSRPLFVAAERSTGGIVSNTQDLMVFLQGFFGGKLFPRKDLETMQNWLQIQFGPLKYGTSLMKFGNLIGHSGSTGSVAYYMPEHDVFIVGATGQLDPAKSLMLMVELVEATGARFRME